MSLVLMSLEGGCATLTLNRPEKLNALNQEMFEELNDHIMTLGDATEEIGVVVLKSTGRAF